MPIFPPTGNWANDYQFGWYEAGFYGLIIALAKAVDVVANLRIRRTKRKEK